MRSLSGTQKWKNDVELYPNMSCRSDSIAIKQYSTLSFRMYMKDAFAKFLI